MLAHQITIQFHKRAGRAISNFATTMAPADSDLAQQATRDPYLFDCVGNVEIAQKGISKMRWSITSESSCWSSARDLRSSAGRFGWRSVRRSLPFYHLKLR